jgi:hypothetical protein
MKNTVLSIILSVLGFLFRFDVFSNLIAAICWGAYLKRKNSNWIAFLVTLYHNKYKLVDSKLVIASEQEAVEAFSIMRNNGAKLNNNSIVASDSVKIVDGMVIAPALTAPTADGEVFILVTPSLLAEQILNEYTKNKVNVKNGWNSIRFCMLHEIWHSNQMKYIIQTGGVAMFNRVMQKELESQYSEGPLEVGANEYAASNRKSKQDLKVFLAA